MNILIPVAIIIICLVGFYVFCIKTSEEHDEQTNRYYRYVKDGNNPTHAPCKNCGESARLIYSVYSNKKRRGTSCMFCYYVIWFDLWEKEDL